MSDGLAAWTASDLALLTSSTRRTTGLTGSASTRCDAFVAYGRVQCWLADRKSVV